MNISTLARRAGISPSGVRWYEATGILPPPPRGPNSYRIYTESDLSRLKLVLTLRRLGLGPVAAGELAGRCLDGGALDPELAAALDDQRRHIAEQREELERLEIELVDLETTIDAAAAGPSAASERGPITVLFVCNGNSARSQMGEALLGRFGGDSFRPISGGTRPKSVHPLTIRVLAELGIDWSAARAKPVTELLHQPLDYVITLSDSAREDCPAIPGPHSALHWHLEDPAAVEGSEEERLSAFRATRTELSVRLRPFIEIARRAAGHLPAVEARSAATQGG
ncbi:MAG TPA: MerR family transcriptional regulator [Candidatus Limnocylindria bacterium]|jgi:arsenate reductase